MSKPAQVQARASLVDVSWTTVLVGIWYFSNFQFGFGLKRASRQFQDPERSVFLLWVLFAVGWAVAAAARLVYLHFFTKKPEAAAAVPAKDEEAAVAKRHDVHEPEEEAAAVSTYALTVATHTLGMSFTCLAFIAGSVPVVQVRQPQPFAVAPRCCGQQSCHRHCMLISVQVFKSLAPIFTTIFSMCYLSAVFPYSAVAAVRTGAGSLCAAGHLPPACRAAHAPAVLWMPAAGDPACSWSNHVQLEHARVQVRASPCCTASCPPPLKHPLPVCAPPLLNLAAVPWLPACSWTAVLMCMVTNLSLPLRNVLVKQRTAQRQAQLAAAGRAAPSSVQLALDTAVDLNFGGVVILTPLCIIFMRSQVPSLEAATALHLGLHRIVYEIASLMVLTRIDAVMHGSLDVLKRAAMTSERPSLCPSCCCAEPPCRLWSPVVCCAA